jgi:hypothetical protein
MAKEGWYKQFPKEPIIVWSHDLDHRYSHERFEYSLIWSCILKEKGRNVAIIQI